MRVNAEELTCARQPQNRQAERKKAEAQPGPAPRPEPAFESRMFVWLSSLVSSSVSSNPGSPDACDGCFPCLHEVFTRDMLTSTGMFS